MSYYRNHQREKLFYIAIYFYHQNKSLDIVTLDRCLKTHQ